MRGPARKLIKSIAKLRSKLRADRGLLSRRLAERYAERLAERPAERRSAGAVPPVGVPIYESVFDHLGAELSAVETELAAAEEAYAAGQDRVAELRHQRDCTIPEVYRGHASIERF